MNLLETHDVVKKYANHLALDKVSIEVPKGKIFGLLGPNGAGKTTLIRIINRISHQISARIAVFAMNVKEQIGSNCFIKINSYII